MQIKAICSSSLKSVVCDQSLRSGLPGLSNLLTLGGYKDAVDEVGSLSQTMGEARAINWSQSSL